MDNKKYCVSIELWRFIYCLMIIALHITATLGWKYGIFFDGGSIGVSFFFIVSGYLMGKKAIKINCKNEEIGKETIDYLINKIKSMFPFILFAYIMCYIYYSSIEHTSIFNNVSSVFELLMLGSSGIRCRVFNYVTWYISVMLICMWIIYPLILKYKNNFMKIVAPVLAILIGGYISSKYGHVAKGDYLKMINIGLFQLLIGVSINPVVEKIKSINFTKISKILFLLIEYIGFLSILFFVNMKNSHVKYDFIMILILTGCITLAFSRNTIIKSEKINKFILFLGKMSLPMFLNQVFIIEIVTKIFISQKFVINYYLIFLVVFIIDFIISFILLKINKIINYKKIKKIFIKESI